MTPARVLRIVFRVILLVVLAGSGTYLLVYLYRWEWNRALISGLFFLIAEIAFLGAVVVRRLGALERRIDDRAIRLDGPRTEAPPADDPVAPTFPWLEPGSLGVFVPVLLGVGAILSALAYLVERLAAATADGARVDPRLAAIGLPRSGLRGSGAVAVAPSTPRPNRRSRTAGVATAVVAVVAIGVLVVLLASGAMYHGGRDPVSGATRVVLRVDARSGAGDPAAVAETLWMTCRGDVDDGIALTGLERLGPDVAALTVAPRVAASDERRFLGCLEDLRFDGLRVEVTTSTDHEV